MITCIAVLFSPKQKLAYRRSNPPRFPAPKSRQFRPTLECGDRCYSSHSSRCNTPPDGKISSPKIWFDCACRLHFGVLYIDVVVYKGKKARNIWCYSCVCIIHSVHPRPESQSELLTCRSWALKILRSSRGFFRERTLAAGDPVHHRGLQLT